MSKYLAYLRGSIPKTTTSYVGSGYEGAVEVPSGFFKDVFEDYKFSARSDAAAIEKARKKREEKYPRTRVKIAGLFKLIQIDIGDKK